MAISKPSLSDTEAGEDGGEDVVGGDAAGDGGEVVEGFAYVLGDEVAGEVVVHPVDGAGNGGACRYECLIMALIGDHDVAGTYIGGSCGAYYGFFKCVHGYVVTGGDCNDLGLVS